MTHFESRQKAAIALAQMADEKGMILTTLPQLSQKIGIGVNSQRIENWKKFGVIRDYELGQQVKNKVVLIECDEEGILNYIHGNEELVPKQIKTQKDGLPDSYKSINQMSFFQKVKTLVKLFQKFFLK